jgi:hypothetical protein
MLAATLWLLGLLPLAIVGAPLMLHPSYRFLKPATRVVLSGAIGAVIVCWLMVLESLVSVSWNLWLLGGLGALCAGALRILVRNEENACIPTPPAGSVAQRGRSPKLMRVASLATACAIVAVGLCTLAGRTASPDLLYHWGPKAQQFASARAIDVAYLKSPFLDYMRPDYPPLVPTTYAWATMMSGNFSWDAAVWLFPVLLALTAISIGGLMELRLGSLRRACARALMVAVIAVIGIASIFGGIAEMPLLFFELSAVALLIFGRGAPCELLAGLCLAGAAATKVEGTVVAFSTVLAYAVLRARRGERLRALLRTGLPPTVILTTWLLFGNRANLFHAYSGYGPLLEIHWRRLPGVLAGVARAAPGSSVLAFLLPLVLLLTVRRWTRPLLVGPAIAILLFAFLVFTYLHGGFDPQEWIGWTAARVLSPIPALLTLTVAEASAD